MAPAAAQENGVCDCPDPRDPDTPPGVVWQGSSPDLSLEDIAGRLAPILWFSSDEPLLVLRDDLEIPQPHPCDRRPAEGAVAYYQATQIVLRGRERVADPPERDPRFFEKTDHFVLKYFFYYEEDFGLRPHRHDLEGVEIDVHLEQTPEGCHRVRVSRITGLAHGLKWYSNILRVRQDTIFPPTILVEEGKHASCPDRNADGIYTPGYDVNLRVQDAWGLRDVTGSARLLGAQYSASMSKPRDARFRLFPPEDAPVCGTASRRIERPAEDALGRYELRRGQEVQVCEPELDDPDSWRLSEMSRSHRFGADWPARQFDSDLERTLADRENVTRWVSALNARYEYGTIGLVAQGPGLDLREAWLVPRLNVGAGRQSVDAFFTPSASRWGDWYVGAGLERLRPGDPERPVIQGFAFEAGLKFRITARGKARWALLGYRFGGVRFGIRAHGISRLREPRLIIEIGAGAF